MKIVYLIAGTYRPAGMERVLSLKAHWLAGHLGAEIVIVTTDQRGQKSVFGLDDFRQIDLGINYELTNGRNFLIKTIAYFFKHLRHRRALTGVLKAERADVVICMFNNDADFVPYIKDGSRKLLEAHFSHYKLLQYQRGGLWGLADRYRYRKEARIAARYDRFIVLTEEDKALWNADYSRLGLKPNVVCIPNPRTFERSDVGTEVRDKMKMVLAVGRYDYQKGFDMLLDSWSEVVQTMNRTEGGNDAWILRVAGDGEDHDRLVEQARSLGISENVVFGKSDDMLSLYAQADVLVLASRYEGLPMVLLEAQAAGLPIVSFACKCGPRDILDPESKVPGVMTGNAQCDTGILVPENDTTLLASAMKQLISNPQLRRRMGAAAFANSSRFDCETIMEKWVEVLGLS